MVERRYRLSEKQMRDALNTLPGVEIHPDEHVSFGLPAGYNPDDAALVLYIEPPRHPGPKEQP